MWTATHDALSHAQHHTYALLRMCGYPAVQNSWYIRQNHIIRHDVKLAVLLASPDSICCHGHMHVLTRCFYTSQADLASCL